MPRDTYKFSIEIPRHIAVQLSGLAGRYKCSKQTIILAGIIDAVETGKRGLGDMAATDAFDFKLRLIEGVYCPNDKRSGGK